MPDPEPLSTAELASLRAEYADTRCIDYPDLTTLRLLATVTALQEALRWAWYERREPPWESASAQYEYRRRWEAAVALLGDAPAEADEVEDR